MVLLDFKHGEVEMKQPFKDAPLAIWIVQVSRAEIDSDISKSEYGAVNDNNDRPPDGDDYNLLWDAIIQEITAGLTP